MSGESTAWTCDRALNVHACAHTHRRHPPLVPSIPGSSNNNPTHPARTCIFWMESTLSRRKESNSSCSMRLRSFVALRSALTRLSMCSLLSARCWMLCSTHARQQHMHTVSAPVVHMLHESLSATCHGCCCSKAHAVTPADALHKHTRQAQCQNFIPRQLPRCPCYPPSCALPHAPGPAGTWLTAPPPWPPQPGA